MEYFEEIFTSSQPNVSAELIDVVPTIVTYRMNSRLLQEFQDFEVEQALKQMHPMKAPGPDGMPPLILSTFLAYCKIYCYTDCFGFS